VSLFKAHVVQYIGPDVVEYIGTHQREDSLNILMEFCPGGSVASLLSVPFSVVPL